MIYLLSIAAVFFVILFYRKTIPSISSNRKILLVVLRSLSIIIILMLLINPILYLIKTELNKPEIIILNDVSESMSTVIKDTTKSSRLDIFSQHLDNIFSSRNIELNKYDFASSLNGAPDNTLLVQTLEEILKKIEPPISKKYFYSQMAGSTMKIWRSLMI